MFAEEKIEGWEEAMNRLLEEYGYIVFAYGPLEIGSTVPDIFDIGPMKVSAMSSRNEALAQAEKVEQWMGVEIQPPPRSAQFYRLVKDTLPRADTPANGAGSSGLAGSAP